MQENEALTSQVLTNKEWCKLAERVSVRGLVEGPIMPSSNYACFMLT